MDGEVPDDWNERTLAARLATGGPEALAAVYDAYARPIYRHAMAILGSESDAEDVLGEVLVKLAGRRGSPIRGLKAYLLTAARNEAYSLLRRRRREDGGWTEDDASAPYTPSPRLAADAEAVREALESLPPEQREVVVLKVYEGLTFAEIGRVIRASANTAASRYRYALGKLRRMLEDAANV